MCSVVREKLDKNRCFEKLEESEAADFSLCFEGVVKDDKECDCGLNYK